MAEFKCVPLDDLVMVLLFFWCDVFVAATLVIFRQNFSATMVKCQVQEQHKRPLLILLMMINKQTS